MADYGFQAFNSSQDEFIESSRPFNIIYRFTYINGGGNGKIFNIPVPNVEAGSELFVVNGLFGGASQETIDGGGGSGLYSVSNIATDATSVTITSATGSQGTADKTFTVFARRGSNVLRTTGT